MSSSTCPDADERSDVFAESSMRFHDIVLSFFAGIAASKPTIFEPRSRKRSSLMSWQHSDESENPPVRPQSLGPLYAKVPPMVDIWDLTQTSPVLRLEPRMAIYMYGIGVAFLPERSRRGKQQRYWKCLAENH